jgi:gliding motility-associated-like protein
MRDSLKAVCLLLFSTLALMGQNIKVNNSFSPVTLVQDVFVNGACKNISNIRAIGNKNGIGFFEGGKTSIGLEKGIILATGNVKNAEGPNLKRDITTDFGEKSSDVDLVKLATGPVFDAVGIEFDFVPLDSFVKFRYVFASDEYCEFVGQQFNDVFGFFVSGPGIQGVFNNKGENVALIPGSNAYVSINNVNHNQNQLFYIDNMHPDDAARCKLPWVSTPNQQKIQYDGFTRPLTATLKLIPCQTYRIRLLVADVSDGRFDSAVFLEAESFNIGGGVKLKGSSVDSAQTIIEGCDHGYFRLDRLNSDNIQQPLIVKIKVSPDSKAKEGIDFERLPKEITIPENKLYVDLPILTFLDNEQETVEELILQLDFPCACISDTARIFIKDAPRLRSGLKDVTFCLGDTLTLDVNPTGGVPPYSYLWGNGSTSSRIKFSPPQDTFLILELKDACKRKFVDTLRVTRKTPPQAQISGIRDICPGDIAEIPVNFNGKAPFSFVWKADSLPQVQVLNIMNPSYVIKSGAKGKIQILSFSDGACAGEFQGVAEIRHYNLQTITSVKPVSCAKGKDGGISIEVSGGSAPYQFNWSNGLPNSFNPLGLSKGLYKVTIVDSKGCKITTEAQVAEPSPLTPIVFDCSQFTSPVLQIGNSGGIPPYSYSVNQGFSFRDASMFNDLVPGNKYDLIIKDLRNCTLEQSFIMPALYQKMVQLDPVYKLDFGKSYKIQPQLNIPFSLVKSISWSPEFKLSCYQCLNPEINPEKGGLIRIQITDLFGCTASATAQITVDNTFTVFIPNAFSPNGDGINDFITVFAGTDQVKEVKRFEIYNRFGDLVFSREGFQPNDEYLGWNGTKAAQKLNPGTYLYSVVVILNNGGEFAKQGSFMLFR